MDIMSPSERQSLDSLRKARKLLAEARSQLGNDHPAYAGLTRLILDTDFLEDLY